MPSSFSPEPKKALSVLGGSLGVVRGKTPNRMSQAYIKALFDLDQILEARSAGQSATSGAAAGVTGPRAAHPVGNTGITSNGVKTHA